MKFNAYLLSAASAFVNATGCATKNASDGAGTFTVTYSGEVAAKI